MAVARFFIVGRLEITERLYHFLEIVIDHASGYAFLVNLFDHRST